MTRKGVAESSNAYLLNFSRDISVNEIERGFRQHYCGWLQPVMPLVLDGEVDYALSSANLTADDQTRFALRLRVCLIANGLTLVDNDGRVTPAWISRTLAAKLGANEVGIPVAPDILFITVDCGGWPEPIHNLATIVSSLTVGFPVVILVALTIGERGSPRDSQYTECVRVGNVSSIYSDRSSLAADIMTVLATRVNSLTNKLSYQLVSPVTKFRSSPSVFSLLAPSFESKLAFNFDTGNRHLSTRVAGNSAIPPTTFMRTSYPSLAVRQEIVNYLFSPAVKSAISWFSGFRRVIYLNVRPYLSLPGIEQESGAHNWHRDFNPRGVCRGILYLSAVDETNGPFTYGLPAKAQTYPEIAEVKTVTGPSGTLILFDGNEILHKGGIPTSSERRVLDLSFVEALDDETEGAYFIGLNTWPSDRRGLDELANFLVTPEF